MPPSTTSTSGCSTGRPASVWATSRTDPTGTLISKRPDSLLRAWFSASPLVATALTLAPSTVSPDSVRTTPSTRPVAAASWAYATSTTDDRLPSPTTRVACFTAISPGAKVIIPGLPPRSWGRLMSVSSRLSFPRKISDMPAIVMYEPAAGIAASSSESGSGTYA